MRHVFAHGDAQAATVAAKLGRNLPKRVAATGKARDGFLGEGGEVVAAAGLAGEAKPLGVVGDCPPTYAKLLRYGLAWMFKPDISQYPIMPCGPLHSIPLIQTVNSVIKSGNWPGFTARYLTLVSVSPS